MLCPGHGLTSRRSRRVLRLLAYAGKYTDCEAHDESHDALEALHERRSNRTQLAPPLQRSPAGWQPPTQSNDPKGVTMDDSHAPLAQRAQFASEMDTLLGAPLALVGAESSIFPHPSGLPTSIALAPRSSAADLGKDIIASIVPAPTAEPRDTVEDRIAGRIAGSIGEAAFARFFGTPGAGRHMALAGTELSVAAPSSFAAALLDRRFKEMLQAAALAESGLEYVSVRFVVTEAAAAERLADHASIAPIRPAPTVRRVTHAQQVREVSAERYALDQFIVGRSSRLALDATIRFVQMPRTSSPTTHKGPSILTIVGPCGVGKSHLLSGASGLALETDAASIVKVTTGEAFVGTFVSAVTGTSNGKSARVDSLRRDHRSADLLCIDDLASIADKPATQTELLHTIDAVTSRGGRVMVTLPDHPRKIRGLGEAIISRLVGGMVATLETPDRETAQRIAMSIATRHGITLDEPAAAFIAAGGGDGAASAGRCLAPSARLASAREMEGLIIKVDAVRRLLGGLGTQAPSGFGGTGGRIGLLGVQRALDVAVGRNPMQRESSHAHGSGGIRPPVRFHIILSTVCRAVGVSQDDVLAKGRPAPVVLARSVCVFMARKLTKMSYPEIATSLARPNHSTVITAYQRIVAAIAGAEVAALASATPGEVLTVAGLVDRLTHELGQ